VLANDSDSNGESITLLSFDASSSLGGSLTRSTGTGPGGRDEVIYTPPPALGEGTDWFKYRIQDSSGMQAVGYAMLRPSSEVLTIVDHWTLDDESGVTAINKARSTQNGTHQNGTIVNQTGANSVTRKGAVFDGSNDQTSIPTPGYNTNTLTFTAWIKRNGSQNSSAAIIFSRAGSSVAGLHFGSANELRYTWDGGAYTWNSGLVPPDNTWCLAAMCVSPSETTLHLRSPTGIQSATNTATHSVEAFDGLMYLGWDSNSASRHYKGALDDVRVYKATLNAADIESLYQQAINPPSVTLTAPLAGSSVQPLNVNFAASVNSMPELVDYVDFTENASFFASSDSTPYQAVVPSVAPGSHVVTARAAYGDWGYQVDSPAVTFTALPAPLPVVSITASLPASKRGPVSGSFTITRDHSIGEITIPISIGGTAVPDADYTAISNTIVLPAGSLSQSITINPIVAPADGVSETVILSLNAASAYTLGAPSSATLTINDHITSIAAGEWDVAETWNSAAAAPTTGTQNTGEGYAVAHTVTSNDSNANSQALFAGSLRVKSGGVLDLARLHATTNQNVSYNLPSTAIENGGIIQFRCSTGSSTHTIAANLAFAGNTTLRINGGSYDNDANLTGTLSGTGTIAFLSNSNAGAGTYVRQLSVNKANNPFAGNWTVNHTGGGDEFAALRAGAANALGTGTVTVGTRAQLVNDNSTGLNSLSGVVMSGTSSSLLLNQPWSNSAASLALTGGTPTVQIGNASSSIGSLTGSVGAIQGSGASSALTLNQTLSSTYAGNLGSNLKLTKSGPAALVLSGSIDSSLALTLASGDLTLPASQTIASFSQTGGSLRQALAPSPSAAQLTISGNFNHSGGNIVVDVTTVPLPDTPYNLVRYQGSLTGVPAVTVNDTSGSGMIAVVSPGTGTDSAVTVLFSVPPPPEYTLTYVAGPGGTISGNAVQSVIEGNDGQPVTAVPDTGYSFVQWSDGSINPVRIETNVTNHLTFTASFAINSYAVGYIASSNGTITGPASQIVDHGANAQTVIAVSEPGAFFAGWSDGLLTAQRTDLQITGPLQVTANFLPGGGPVSIAAGNWASAATWNHNLAAPVSGTQGSGFAYLIEGFTVSSNDPASNSQALIGASLTVRNGGMLDLARNHNNTLQNVSHNLPPLSLTGLATVRFRASNGSSSHQLGTSLAVSENNTLLINGGNYTNEATLSGAISGGGNLAVLSESNAVSTVGNVRQITVSSANNSYAGNWTVNHTASGDDYAALRANAPNALGSGSVTVGVRSRLINSVLGGIDSLAGITLSGSGSRLILTQPWSNPASSLAITANDAVVEIGGSISSIGNLSGNSGTITGSVAGASLSVNQTTSTIFGGALGGSLGFTKTGPATLTLAGANTHTGSTLVSAGTLAGTGSANSDLTVGAAGTLDLESGVFLTKAATFEDGSILTATINSASSACGKLIASGPIVITPNADLDLTDSETGILPNGTKLILIEYSGQSITGSFTGLAEGADVAVGNNSYIIAYNGTLGGTGSFVTLTVANSTPYELWIDSFATITDPADRPATADADDDGLANAVEFVLGTNPSLNSPGPVLSTQIQAGSFLFSFSRDKAAGEAGFTSHIELSDTLGEWTTAPAESTQINVQGATEIVTVTVPSRPAPIFARLRVSAP
jgi:autotransporter-associated beta strand protein